MRPSLALLLLAAFCTTASAQTQTPSTSNPPAPAGSLSDRLDKSDGVIKPQEDIDPKIAKPAPEPHPNSTPVIPPPGSPGGRKDIEPK